MVSAWSYVVLAAVVALACAAGAWRLTRDPARDPARRRSRPWARAAAAAAPRGRARRGRSRR